MQQPFIVVLVGVGIMPKIGGRGGCKGRAMEAYVNTPSLAGEAKVLAVKLDREALMFVTFYQLPFEMALHEPTFP